MTALPTRRRRPPLCGLLALVLLAVGCVDEPPPRPADGWLLLEPGAGRTVELEDSAGLLEGISLQIPPDAVAEATSIRVSIASATTPVFYRAGLQLRTPAVRIDPLGVEFRNPLVLGLPFYPLGDTVEAPAVRGYTAPGVEGIAAGLWESVEPRPDLPVRVELDADHAGVFWAATAEQNPARKPADVLGEPCVDAEADLAACAKGDCGVSGCLGEFCGQDPGHRSSCRPSLAVSAHFGCDCRCGQGLCQWVR